ncbi:MAG: DUF1489 domain-containing protein [Alphaproteobacteria bacterium]|nr:DUF1489 domain-containing protein [Alphaproteobacteria bacterium]
MTLNIKKLCVGADSVSDLYNRQEYIRNRYGETIHITRMFPKRFEEILNGGSIYWVIKGKLCVRQEILKIERFVDNDNVKRCRIDLNRDLILTVPFKERPFQGWRYLEIKNSPSDTRLFDINNMDDDQEIISDLHSLGLV